MTGWRECKTCGGYRRINTVRNVCKECGNDPDTEPKEDQTDG